MSQVGEISQKNKRYTLVSLLLCSRNVALLERGWWENPLFQEEIQLWQTGSISVMGTQSWGEGCGERRAASYPKQGQLHPILTGQGSPPYELGELRSRP